LRRPGGSGHDAANVMEPRMSLSRRLILALAAAAFASPAFAQSWPSKTIRIVVPFPAGGSADLSARLLADHLKNALGQGVVVESKVGAGGNLAAAEAARAEADGHTLFIGTNGTQTINQSLYSKIPYNPSADFAPIAMMWEAPHLLVVHPSVPAQTLPEFIAYARSNKLSYGSSGVGSSTHLFGEMFKAATGADIAHVPYRGQGPALTDLISGQLQLMFPIAPDVIGQVRANAVKPLAAARASAVLPGVPLMAALGHPDLVASAWTALYVPAKTPADIVARLRKETEALMASPAFVERMNGVGIEIRPMQAPAFEKFTQDERTRWAKTIEALKVKID
jgi:tripartite-type tricarboxylate transporter receptor subunit TctC